MTHPGDALRDLVRDVPDHLRIDHRAAWTAGSRRRRRRAGALAAVAVAMVASLGALVGVLPAPLPTPAPAGSTARVSGHPVRIGHSWWVRPLPDRPGPIAGLVEHGDGFGWYAVSATGRLWELPDLDTGGGSYPTLSPEGTRIGFLHPGGTYEIRDLVSGARTRFPSVGNGVFDGSIPHNYDHDHTYSVSDQTPNFWSPDGRNVMTMGSLSSGGNDHALLLSVDGSVRLVRPRVGQDAVWPAGWTPTGDIGWLRADDQGDGSARDVTYLTTSMTGRVLSSRLLHGAGQFSSLSQWSGQLSPDARKLAVTQEQDLDGNSVQTYSTGSGGHIGPVLRFGAADQSCATVWQRGRPIAPSVTGVGTGGSSASSLLPTADGPVVVADPRLGVGCSVWAQSALDGPGESGPAGHLFGVRTATWTWWWQEGLAGLALMGALVMAPRLRHARRGRRPDSPTTP